MPEGSVGVAVVVAVAVGVVVVVGVDMIIRCREGDCGDSECYSCQDIEPPEDDPDARYDQAREEGWLE